ncbi:hypothetical protein BS47DRAFT_1487089 [Hydnum rufescens UP504]|uniref:Uncharacterized protein n=1 Tax=Hydnum rufescens UP504 TaxID=1448309 RepID=A0A9P6ASR2_9AGAM|nr:hypothetical protein BS47DRAFT_1487089 [Hydnum rufescens UP504]
MKGLPFRAPQAVAAWYTYYGNDRGQTPSVDSKSTLQNKIKSVPTLALNAFGTRVATARLELFRLTPNSRTRSRDTNTIPANSGVDEAKWLQSDVGHTSRVSEEQVAMEEDPRWEVRLLDAGVIVIAARIFVSARKIQYYAPNMVSSRIGSTFRKTKY